ncbi:MAG: sigma-70 family RNA polymerase sigma factor [Opitutus sp.]|nr:sigma-70 family RNA polymerase sigma factor [Opitutus sp.]
MSDITHAISAIQNGEPRAAAQLLPLVYDELRKLAAQRLAQERPGQTLQATALVHEAWLRIAGGDPQTWNGRGHFFGAAAEAMRRILIDNARRKLAVRHGGGLKRVDVNGGGTEVAAPVGNDDELLAVHDALDRLAVQDARKAELVKLRYFVGLTIEEAAEALGMSEATAKRDWVYARAWLRREIEGHRG